MRLPALLWIMACLSGCIALPDIDDGVTAEAEAAAYPVLRPREEIIATVTANQSDEAEERAALDERVRTLEARAAAVQGAVITRADRDRLERDRP